MGKKGLSKQALSLIEKSRMKIPASRLLELKIAYRLSTFEQLEFEHILSRERLVENTGLDREFGEAILSVVDREDPSYVYVIGGRVLSLQSPILKAKAAEFLQRTDNRLIFIYPDCAGLTPLYSSLWYPNNEREITQVRRSVQECSKRTIESQILFYGIDVSRLNCDLTLLQVLSLCGPFTAITIASSQDGNDCAGYIYVEGPKDRWILLKPEDARRAINVITSVLFNEGHGRLTQKQVG